jgi:hypothetical protein
MKTTTFDIHSSPIRSFLHNRSGVFVNLKGWVEKQEPVWEYNRLGIAAAGILIQVTFAGAMLAILAIAGASPFVYTVGIFFSFMANSIAFAQRPMRWVLGVMMASIVLDVFLILVYGIQLI